MQKSLKRILKKFKISLPIFLLSTNLFAAESQTELLSEDDDWEIIDSSVGHTKPHKVVLANYSSKHIGIQFFQDGKTVKKLLACSNEGKH